MSERSNIITFKGNPMTLEGSGVSVGQPLNVMILLRGHLCASHLVAP